MIYESKHRRPYNAARADREVRAKILRNTRKAAIAAKRVWLEM